LRRLKFALKHLESLKHVGGVVMTEPHPIVFLVDVDNTLLDNDRIRTIFSGT
jgi:hypothetical protein